MSPGEATPPRAGAEMLPEPARQRPVFGEFDVLPVGGPCQPGRVATAAACRRCRHGRRPGRLNAARLQAGSIQAQAAAGSHSVTVVPTPGSLASAMRPPSSSTISLTMLMPRPVPGMLPEVSAR